jgi:molecular chaperone GrpE
MSEEKKKRSKEIENPIAESEEVKGEIKEEIIESVSQDTPETEVAEPVKEPVVELTTLPVEELTALKDELEAVQNKSREYFEGWQRERADFINYKKRIERDQVQLNQIITANILKKFLPILDDMELAIKNRPENASDQSWWEGVELIARKLQGILEAEGVTRIPAEDEFFDPNRHEAISHEENPAYQSGQVIEVVKQGYMLGDRVIRPALVRVAR